MISEHTKAAVRKNATAHFDNVPLSVPASMNPSIAVAATAEPQVAPVENAQNATSTAATTAVNLLKRPLKSALEKPFNGPPTNGANGNIQVVHMVKQGAHHPGVVPGQAINHGNLVTVQGQQVVMAPPGSHPPGAIIVQQSPAGNPVTASAVPPPPAPIGMTGMMANIHLNTTAVPPPITIHCQNGIVQSWSSPVLDEFKAESFTITEPIRKAFKKLDSIILQAVKERNQFAEMTKLLVNDISKQREISRRYVAIIKQLQPMVPIHVQVGVKMDLDEIAKISSDPGSLAPNVQLHHPVVPTIAHPAAPSQAHIQHPPPPMAHCQPPQKRSKTSSSPPTDRKEKEEAVTKPKPIDVRATQSIPTPSRSSSNPHISRTPSVSTSAGFARSLSVSSTTGTSSSAPPLVSGSTPTPVTPTSAGSSQGLPVASAQTPQSIPLQRLPKMLKVHCQVQNEDVVCAMAISRPFKYLFTACTGTVKIWDVAQQGAAAPMVASIECNPKHYIRAMKVTPDGKTLLTAGEFQEIALCNISTTTPHVAATIPTPNIDTYAIGVTNDSAFAITCGSDHLVHIWDIATRRLARSLKGHTGPVTSCSLSKDGSKVFTGSIDNTIRVWDINTGNELEVYTFPSHIYSFDIDPIAKVLTAGLKDTIFQKSLTPEPNSTTNLTTIDRQTSETVENCSWPAIKYSRQGGWYLGANTIGKLQIFRSVDSHRFGEITESEAILCADVSACGEYLYQDNVSSEDGSSESDGYISEDEDDVEDMDSLQVLKMMTPIIIPLLARAMGRYLEFEEDLLSEHTSFELQLSDLSPCTSPGLEEVEDLQRIKRSLTKFSLHTETVPASKLLDLLHDLADEPVYVGLKKSLENEEEALRILVPSLTKDLSLLEFHQLLSGLVELKVQKTDCLDDAPVPLPGHHKTSGKSMLPRPIPTTPLASAGDNINSQTTPPQCLQISRESTSPTFFGRKRTTPIASDSTSARRAFETTKSRSSTSGGGLVAPCDEDGADLLAEEALDLEDCRLSPLNDSIFDQSGPAEEFRFEGDVKSGIRHESIYNMGTNSVFSTPSHSKEPEVFHTPMTTISNRHALSIRQSNFTCSSPTPQNSNYSSRGSPHMSLLREPWTGNSFSVSGSSSFMSSNGGNSPSSGRMTPRTYRDFIYHLTSVGLSDEAIRKALKLESMDDEDYSEDVSGVQYERLMQIVVTLTKKLKEHERATQDTQKNAERDVLELQLKVDDLQKEIGKKRKEISSLKTKERHSVAQIEMLTSDIQRLNLELQSSRQFCQQLKEDMGKQTDLKIRLTNDLRWKEEVASQTQSTLEIVEKDLRKNLDEKIRLQKSLQELQVSVANAETLVATLMEENKTLRVSVESLQNNVDDFETETNHFGSPLALPEPNVKTNRLRPLNLELDSAYGSQTDSAAEEPRGHFKYRHFIPASNTDCRLESGHITNFEPSQLYATQAPHATRTDDLPKTAEICLQTDPILPPSPMERSESSTQVDSAQYAEISVGTEEDEFFLASAMIEVGSQTDPKLGMWRPMPELSISNQILDLTFPEVTTVDVMTQSSAMTLSVGVQCGHALDLWTRHVQVQTIETSDDLNESDKTAEVLKARCLELEAAVKELEAQALQFMAFKADVDSLDQCNLELRNQLDEVQGIAQETRRRLNLRKHFDAEVERWIANLRQQIDSINETVIDAKDALDLNTTRQASASAKIMKLQQEIERYKELTAHFLENMERDGDHPWNAGSISPKASTLLKLPDGMIGICEVSIKTEKGNSTMKLAIKESEHARIADDQVAMEKSLAVGFSSKKKEASLNDENEPINVWLTKSQVRHWNITMKGQHSQTLEMDLTVAALIAPRASLPIISTFKLSFADASHTVGFGVLPEQLIWEELNGTVIENGQHITVHALNTTQVDVIFESCDAEGGMVGQKTRFAFADKNKKKTRQIISHDIFGKAGKRLKVVRIELHVVLSVQPQSVILAGEHGSVVFDQLEELFAIKPSDGQKESIVEFYNALELIEVTQRLPGKNILLVGLCSNISNTSLRLISKFFQEIVEIEPLSFEARHALLNFIFPSSMNLDTLDLARLSQGIKFGSIFSLRSAAFENAWKRLGGPAAHETKINETELCSEDMQEQPLSRVHWHDIGGIEAGKNLILECIEWPIIYGAGLESMGITVPKGILLYGPSGTGKSMIAQAISNRNDIYFVSVTVPDIIKGEIGESEKAIAHIFRDAQKSQPSVIFFDQIDSIFSKQGIANDNFHQKVYTQLLQEIDSLPRYSGVLVLAAANSVETLDDSLLRPGRIDRLVELSLPDEDNRLSIITALGTKIQNTHDAANLARLTSGLSGADIREVMYKV
ncbi:Cell division control protein 48 B [Phlyctochytrium planicorne]|nr:Cell division control protein 48 B [Phlyctochytrium planicorne]